MNSHLLGLLILAVTAVLVTLLLRNEVPLMTTMTIAVVLTILIMVVGGAGKYLPSVLRILVQLFRGKG